MPLEPRKHVVPKRRLFSRLNLRQIKHNRRRRFPQPLLVIHHVKHQIHNRRRETRPVGLAHVTVIQMQTASPKNLSREPQLLPPVVHNRAPEKSLPPFVHLAGNFFSHPQKSRIAGNRHRQVPLILKRNRLNLPQRILAIKHPPIRPRKQRISRVPQTASRASPRFSNRPGTLNPLPLQIPRNFATFKFPIPRILHANRSPRNHRLRIEKADPLPPALPFQPPRHALRHHRASFAIERRQNLQRLKRRRGKYLRVRSQHATTIIKPLRHKLFLREQFCNRGITANNSTNHAINDFDAWKPPDVPRAADTIYLSAVPEPPDKLDRSPHSYKRWPPHPNLQLKCAQTAFVRSRKAAAPSSNADRKANHIRKRSHAPNDSQ